MNRWLVVAAVVLSVGCARVRPWERGTLADPAMQVGGEPEEAAQLDHTLAAREQAMPAGAGRGGGCGCN